MYDLETIRRLNEEAVHFAMSVANTNESPSKRLKSMNGGLGPTPVFPLSILGRKLSGGPPSLAYFVSLLQMSESFSGFRKLVMDYMPEYEGEIMVEALDRRAQKFCLLFSQKYFPLRWEALNGELDISDIVSGIPWQPMGFSIECFHEFQQFRPGYILALSLVECPWEGDPYEDGFFGEDIPDDREDGTPGIRIPLHETVREIIGEQLARLMPPAGFNTDHIRAKTAHTEFDGLADFSDWVHLNTGNAFLDTLGQEIYLNGDMEWGEPESNDRLISDWEDALYIISKVHKMALHLEEDPPATFRRLLSLLLENPDLVVPKEQIALPI